MSLESIRNPADAKLVMEMKVCPNCGSIFKNKFGVMADHWKDCYRCGHSFTYLNGKLHIWGKTENTIKWLPFESNLKEVVVFT